MANYEPTGVKLVAEGKDEYLSALRAAREATRELGTTAAGQAAGGMNQMNAASMALSVAVGATLASAVTAAASAVVNFSTAAIGNASYLQDVQLNIESLTAAEIIGSGATDDMTTALAQAGPVAVEVMNRLKALSLQSPFEYRQILSVYSLNKQFGQSTEMSLELTRAITNLGAANKSIPGILERVTYNFSQMALTGKITMADVRQLAQAGVQLSTVFDKQLGKSIDQVNADLESGAMTFEDVSKAFVEYSDKYFGTAAERASKTFSGLVSSFKDLAFFASTDIFSGSLGVVTERMGAFFTQAQDFINSGGLLPIGALLEVVTEGLFGLADSASQAGQGFFDAFGGKMQETASAALSWGANIVIQLASGLIEGASTALTYAMDSISQLLSYFLAPGSPPRVAPNIDQWGADAIGEYLKGFTEADFSTLSAIEGPLNTALSALAGGGKIDKDAQAGIFQSISKQIAEVIATGADAAPVLENIRAQLGEYGGAVADLTEKQLRLGLALNAVEQAEKDLEAARAAETKANDDLVRITNEYNELASSGASSETLAAKRAEFALAKKQRAEAHKAGKIAEANLDTSKKEADALKEKADLQESFTKQLIDLTKQQVDAIKTLAAGAGKALSGASGGKVNVGGMTEELTKKMDELKENIRKKLSDAFKPLVDAWNTASAKVSTAWETFTAAVGGFYDKYLKEPIEKLKEFIPPEFGENLGWATGVVLAFAAGVAIILGIIAAVGTALSSPFTVILLIIGLVAVLKTAWDENWLGIRDTLTQVWNDTIYPTLSSVYTWLATNIPLAIQTVTDWWNNTFLPALQAIWNWINTNLIPIFQSIYTWLATNIPLAIQTVSSYWTDTLLPAITSVWSWLSGTLWPFLSSFSEFLTSIFGLAIRVVANFIQFQLAKALRVANALWIIMEPAVKLVETALSAVGKVISDNVKVAFDDLQKLLNDYVKPVIEFIGDFVGVTMVKAFEDLTGWLEKAADWFGKMADKINALTLPDWLTPGSPTPLETGIRGIAEAFGVMTGSTPDGAVGGDFAAGMMTAITTISTTITTMFLPLLGQITTWATITMPLAFLTFSTSLATILTPAIQIFMDWISSEFIPFMQTVIDLFQITLVEAILAVTTGFQDGLSPAILLVWSNLVDSLLPILDTLFIFIQEKLLPILQQTSDFVGVTMVNSMNAITTAVYRVVDAVNDLFDALRRLNNAKGLFVPHSPTAFEMGMRGIREAMDGLNQEAFPALSNRIGMVGRRGLRAFGADATAGRMNLAGAVNPVVVEKNGYQLTLQTSMNAQSVEQGFDTMRLLGG